MDRTQNLNLIGCSSAAFLLRMFFCCVPSAGRFYPWNNFGRAIVSQPSELDGANATHLLEESVGVLVLGDVSLRADLRNRPGWLSAIVLGMVTPPEPRAAQQRFDREARTAR